MELRAQSGFCASNLRRVMALNTDEVVVSTGSGPVTSA